MFVTLTYNVSTCPAINTGFDEMGLLFASTCCTCVAATAGVGTVTNGVTNSNTATTIFHQICLFCVITGLVRECEQMYNND